MSDRVLVDIDHTGVAEYAHFNSDGELEALEWVDDVEAVLDDNKRLQTDGTGGYGKTREWKHEARIPFSVIRKWEVEMGVPINFLQTKEGMPHLIKKYKDRDYCFFRTDK